MDNFMTLKIKAISENESFARSAVAAFCTGLNPTIDQIDEIKTAVSEAVTNSIVHGYSKGDGIVEIEAFIAGRTLHIDIKDEGVGISDIKKAREPFYTTRAEEERTGMGFTIMESFMDTLEIIPNPKHGVTVRMTKCLACNKHSSEGTEFVRTGCSD